MVMTQSISKDCSASRPATLDRRRATLTIVGTVHRFVLAVACVLSLSVTGPRGATRGRGPDSAAARSPTPDEAVFTDTVKPFLFRNCYQCHNERRTKGNLNLKRYTDAASVLADPNTWEHVLLKIRTGEMPPEDEPRPTPAELRLVIGVGGRADPPRRPHDATRSRARHDSTAQPDRVQQHGP